MELGDVGLPYMIVQVDDLGGEMAWVKDQYGKKHRVRLDIRRGKGPFPKVGETWIVDRTLGHWAFAACLVPDLPIITGTTDDIPALKNLIAALEDIGLIVNQTTNTRVRADTPHTHMGVHGATGPDLPTPEPA
jgi:hypothetical protein